MNKRSINETNEENYNVDVKITDRNKCIVTGADDLEHLYTFKDFPIFMGCVEVDGQENDLTSDMSWWISKGSGSIQLNPIPDPDLVYPASHGSGTMGKAWDAHHTELAEFILKFKGKSTLEIGGGHGRLANYILDKKKDVKWSLIDPNPSVAARDNLTVIRGFFSNDSDHIYDTIVHSHLFEHMIDPLDFCRNLFKALDNDGYLIFSIPNLGEMLKKKYTNILNFEHTFFLSEYFAEYFLKNSGFEIVEKKLFLADHSIFYAARKSFGDQTVSLMNNYEVNFGAYNNYVDYHIKLVNSLNAIINDAGKKVFLFGGHVMSQFLIAFGLNSSKVQCVIDNDESKHGKRLNGTNLIVRSPLTLRMETDPIVILRAGTFQSEISEQLRLINSAVRIVPTDNML